MTPSVQDRTQRCASPKAADEQASERILGNLQASRHTSGLRCLAGPGWTILSCLFLFLGIGIAGASGDLNFITNVSGAMDEMQLVGENAFCATPSGLVVLDVGDAANPVLMGLLQLPGPLRGIAVREEYVYIMGTGLHIVDISDPTRPFEVGFLEISTSIFGNSVILDGDYVYVTSYEDLHVIDISNPHDPEEVATLQVSSNQADMDMAGSTLYLGAEYHGLHAVDISDPLAPTLIGFADVSAYGLTVRKDLAYLVAGRFLRIVDVSDPSEMTLLGECSLDYEFQPVSIFSM